MIFRYITSILLLDFALVYLLSPIRMTCKLYIGFLRTVYTPLILSKMSPSIMVFDSISWAWRFHKYISWHAIAPRIWVFKGKLSLEYIMYRRELSTDVLEVLLSANSTPDKHRQNTKNNICIRHTRKIVVGFFYYFCSVASSKISRFGPYIQYTSQTLI